MKWTPFTLHVKVTPKSDGTRVSYFRSLQRFGQDLYDALNSEPDFNMADPGGGNYTQRSSFNNAKLYNGGSLITSSYKITTGMTGAAVKPQFGNYPAQLMMTGFYNSDSENSVTEPEIQILSANEVWTQSLAAKNVNIPSTFVNDEVKAIRAIIDPLIATYMPTYANAKVHRLEYSGIIFGDRGFHFPA